MKKDDKSPLKSKTKVKSIYQWIREHRVQQRKRNILSVTSLKTSNSKSPVHF